MFGISPLGWIHTIGSLPAIPSAAYMLARHGRIVPRSKAGAVYFGSMLLGAATIFPIAHAAVSAIIATLTLAFMFVGYGVGRLPSSHRAIPYVETITLSVTTLLLMLPTATETLRRLPDGHPLVTDLSSPLLRGVHLTLFLGFLVGVAAQILRLRKQSKPGSARDAAVLL
jgi:hypothetical protein